MIERRRLVVHQLKVALALSMALSGVLLPAVGRAEVYRWVDEQGKVHFGDRPKDAATAAKAEAVEVREAYRPAEQSAGEAAAQQASQASELEYQQLRRAEQRKEQDAARAEREKQRLAQCKKDAALLSRITEVQMEDGRRTMYYLTDENGKSLKATEQKQRIDELRARVADCP